MALKLKADAKPDFLEKPDNPPIIGEGEPQNKTEIEEKPPALEAQKTETAEDEAAAVLQKQIDDLKRSEELQRQQAAQANRDRDEAIKQARLRDAEINKFQREAQESNYDAITSALAAATAAAEKAQLDIENAIATGDAKAQAEAYRHLAKAESNIARLEDGKTAFEEQRKRDAEKPPVTQQQQTQQDPLDRSGLPETAKTWLRAHPDYLQDARKNSKIQSLHWDVLDEGHAAFSTEYFKSLEEHLGLRQRREERAEDQQKQQQQEQQRSSIVSAPVSREAPAGSGTRKGQLRLSKEQYEAAKMAGVTAAEYAKQLEKINEMKANGSYGDRQ